MTQVANRHLPKTSASSNDQRFVQKVGKDGNQLSPQERKNTEKYDPDCKIHNYKYGDQTIQVISTVQYDHDLLDHILDKGPLPFHTTRAFARQIGTQLQNMHNNNDVHRDLKPENIMYRSHAGHEEVKIIDFGHTSSVETSSNKISSPLYAAP